LLGKLRGKKVKTEKHLSFEGGNPFCCKIIRGYYSRIFTPKIAAGTNICSKIVKYRGDDMNNINLIIGILGMILLLLAFALNLLKKVTEHSISYILLNIFGAGISFYYAYTLNAVPFIILEVVWALFAIYKLIVVAKQKQLKSI